MAKIKTLTSMSRDGVAIPNRSEIDIPEAEAVALCTNGLAEPIGWDLESGPSAGDTKALSSLSKTAITALAKVGVNTDAEARAYVASGKALKDIDGLSDAQADKLSALLTTAD